MEINRHLHVLASLSFTHGRAKFTTLSSDQTHIWQYDVGGELNAYREINDDVVFRPFLGVGGGVRAYDYQSQGVPTRQCIAGYGAVGSEFEVGPVGLRFEARDYVTCFKSPFIGKRDTRNDLGLAVGFAYHFR